jgi:hypothetical protein
VDDYVETTTLGDIDEPMTISLWMKTDELNQNQCIFGRNKETGAGYYYENQLSIGGDTRDRLKFGDRVGGGGDSFIYSNTPVETDVWYHVAVTRDSGSNINFYVNGVWDGGGSAVNVDNTGINYRIGTINTGHWPFNGIIDDVRIYERVLSLREIQQLYKSGLAGYSGLEPFFVDVNSGDYRLKSEGWRWSHGSSGGWAWDDVTSPCIDAGNPGTPLGDELMTVPRDPNNVYGVNLRVNMGAYGGTAQASIPPHGWALLGDLDNDGGVDLLDLAGQAEDWRISDSQQPGDLNRDGVVNIIDLAKLVADWLQTTY